MTQRRDAPSDQAKIRVMKRDRFRCVYCGESGNDAELEIDHVVPVSRGGSHHISNLATACRACNQAKGNRTTMRPKQELLDERFVFNKGKGQCGKVLRDIGDVCEVELYDTTFIVLAGCLELSGIVKRWKWDDVSIFNDKNALGESIGREQRRQEEQHESMDFDLIPAAEFVATYKA